MKKKIAIGCIIVALFVAFMALGIGVSANHTKVQSRRGAAYAGTWYEKNDIELVKNVDVKSTCLNKEAVLSTLNQESKISGDKKVTEELIYVVTNKIQKDNPVDVYRDSKKNEYRFTQNGELNTYIQNYSERRDLAVGEEPCTKEDSIQLAWNYVQNLFGDRTKGFVLNYCDSGGQYNADYHINFAKKYGVDDFIIGPRILAIIQPTGDLSGATITKDAMEDFDPTLVKNLTKQMVVDWAVAEFEAKNLGHIPGSIGVEDFYLERFEDRFRLRVGVTWESETGANIETLYYEFQR